MKTQTLSLDGYILRTKFHYPEQMLENGHQPYLVRGIGRLTAELRAEIRVLSSEHMKGTKK